jgi:outer membrane protein insertion porin family
MERRHYLLPVAGIVLLASLPAAAQKFLPKSIQFRGDPEYSDQELLAATGLKKGTVLTYTEMSDHGQQLVDSGVFESVTFKYDGQDLIFYLKPADTLYPIRLDNLPLAPGTDLDARLHDRLPLYHGKVPADGTLLNNVRAALEEMLAAQGIKAAVTAIPAGVAGSRKVTVMNFDIASPPVRVGPIDLKGVSSAMQDQIKRVVDHAVGAPYDAANSAKNLEDAFALFYADQGYAAVKAHAERAGNPVATAEAIDVPFSVSVEEGRLYKLSEIHLPPDALVTQAEIDKSVAALKDGHIKGIALRSAWFFIASRYKSKGHLDCRVTPHAELDEAAGTVSYTVDINPGPVYHLAFVKFENASDELRSRLMRSWQMLPGDVFDESYVSNFLVKAEKDDPVLQRGLAGIKISYDVRADPDSHDVNCVIRFEKRQSTP